MNEEHKNKIKVSNQKHYASLSEEEKRTWNEKRQQGRKRTFELIKQLREHIKNESKK